MKYGFGSWLGENAGNIIKTGAGAALTATGVAAPIGIGLMASGATDMATNTLTEDPNAQAALRATGQVAGIAGGAMMGKVGYAMGGNTKLSEFNNGGTHEENPNGGIPIGQNASVEQGETKWQDYIFSDRISTGNKKETFADASKKIQKKYTRENDAPSQKALEREMKALMNQQEMFRQELGMTSETQMANGGRIQYPDGGTLPSSTPTYGGASIGTDSKGRSVYDPAKVRPKVREYFEANPSLFVAVGPPKMESGNTADKDAIMKSLNKSQPTIKTTPIPSDGIKWMKEPGIKGWRQGVNPKTRQMEYKKVDEVAEGLVNPETNTYMPIQKAMGGRIKINDGGGLNTNSFIALNQTLNPNLGNLNPNGTPVSVNPYATEIGYSKSNPQDGEFPSIEEIEAESNAAVLAEQNRNAEAQTNYNTPSTGVPTITTGFSSLGKPTAPVETAGVTESAESSTPTSELTTDTNNPDSSGTYTPRKLDGYDWATMGAQALPALYNLGKGLKGSKKIQYGRLNPNLVNYDASKRATEASYDQQGNIMRESIRENATSSGQALSNKVAFANRAAADKAQAISGINEREFNANQQIRGNTDQSNLQVSINEEIANAQQDAANQQAIATGLGQLGQVAGMANRDRLGYRYQAEDINALGEGREFKWIIDPVTKQPKKVSIYA